MNTSLLTLLCTLPIGQPEMARVDLIGDPLPAGAVARLGTARLRMGGFVYGLSFSPEGKTLASGGIDNSVRLWEVATGKELRRFEGHGHDPWVTSAVISPDGKLLASAGANKVIQLWDVKTGKKVRLLKGHEGVVSSLAFSPDGDVLISGSGIISGGDGSLRIWEVHTGKELARQVHPGQVPFVAFAREGKLFATACEDGKARLWSLPDAKPAGEFVAGAPVTRVALSSDGKLLAVGTDRRDPKVLVFETGSGKEIRRLRSPSFGVGGLAFGQDDKTIFVTGSNRDERREQLVVQWRLDTGTEVRRFGPEQNQVTSLAVSRDGETLAIGTSSAVELYDIASGKSLHDLPGHRLDIQAVAFAPDGGTIATGGTDGSIRLWDAMTGKPHEPMAENVGRVSRLRFLTGGKELISAEADGIIVYEMRTRRAVRRIAEKVNVWDAAFSGDGSLVAAAFQPGRELRVWDSSGKAHSNVPMASVRSVLLSADGKRLIFSTSGFDGAAPRLTLWDLADNKKLGEFDPPRSMLIDTDDTKLLALSPDGSVLAVRRAEHSAILLVDAQSGKQLVTLPATEHPVFCAAFSPDGKLLALGNWDHRTRLYDAATGKELTVLAGHQGYVNAIAFSPDGRRLVSGSGDGTALVWDISRWRKK